jgi:hypothetical protein
MTRVSIRSGTLGALLLLLLASTSARALEIDTLVNAALTAENQRLGERLAGDLNGAPFLEKALDGANVKLKVFDAGEAGQDSSLGFEYSYSRDIAGHAFERQKQRHAGLALNFAADGNVAFDREANPNDFLKTSLAFLYYRSAGGVLPEKPDPALLNRLEDAAAAVDTVAALEKLSEWQQLAQTVRDHLSDQYYFDMAGTGGLESDQSFIKKQYYYGVHASLLAKGWNADRSALAKFNIVDYPAALLRLLSGADSRWRPRGSAFPEFLIGLDHLEPNDDSPRQTLAGDDSGYERARVEVSYRTLAAVYKEASLFLEANFRHYREISPSAEIKAAGLDEHTYFTVALLMPQANGLYLSYTTGKLPLDAEDDQVYELGFKYQF